MGSKKKSHISATLFLFSYTCLFFRAGIVHRFLLAFEFHLAEAESDACGDEAAVEGVAVAHAEQVGVGVLGAVADGLAPIEDVLDADEG